MKPARKKQLGQLVVGAVLLWAVVAKAKTRGNVLIGPVTVTKAPRPHMGAVTDADVQRLTLARTRAKQLMGADPNTLASVQPTGADLKFVEDTIQLQMSLYAVAPQAIPAPKDLLEMLALARKLPGKAMQQENARLYDALGVDPRGDNEPTLPLTAERDQVARSVISKWRPYSQPAVDTLFVLLDGSRELAVGNA